MAKWDLNPPSAEEYNDMYVKGKRKKRHKYVFETKQLHIYFITKKDKEKFRYWYGENPSNSKLVNWLCQINNDELKYIGKLSNGAIVYTYR